jgi:hypothetical protein
MTVLGWRDDEVAVLGLCGTKVAVPHNAEMEVLG